MKKLKVIAVQWLDSCRTEGWRQREDVCAYSVIESIGFLIYENEKGVVISSSVSVSTDNAADQLSIPKCSILKRRFVKV